MPHLVVYIADIEPADTCNTCGGCRDDLQRRAGDNVCGQCDMLFTAAHALLDNNVREEPTILGTLTFAWSRGAWVIDSGTYGGLELLSNVDGVPLVRLPRITAGVITYEGSRIPRVAKISVYSRDVTSKEFAEGYERLLVAHGIHYNKCSGGSVSWDLENANLTMKVRAMKELPAWRVGYYEAYPAGRIYSFPPPTLVGGFYDTLLGSTDERTFSGYGYALAEAGRHTPQKAVTGSVAWLLGDRTDDEIPPRERRPRIAKALNKHLLRPRDEVELVEDGWVSTDTVWRAASVLGPRLMRNLYHLQEGYRQ